MGCVLGSRTAASSPVSEGSLRLTHVRLMSGSILPKADTESPPKLRYLWGTGRSQFVSNTFFAIS